ncbi:uncharacterized protein LOC127717467 isoform X2 [Mytilus californianus]|uniref:uncharacterized protein LOC127717467 isoform X2 n=1 Tax=Mytilus californianus TaxID=6549 RepID=UPI0022463134|nr:uncharacterized protein LOC127717467 isoform X2 [Mytilus californianus]
MQKLICNPNGNPENYTFADWEHWSEFNEHIRNVQGTPDGTLTLLESNNNNKLHENDGIYKCRTSNGIYGTNGNLYQKGTALINDRVPPIFVNANKPIQFGSYGQKMNLTVHLYNKYGTIQTTISKLNETLNIHGRQERILTQDVFHGVNVTVSGIKITFQLTLDKIEDLTEYTTKACNEKGCNDLTVKIKLTSDRPKPPTNVSVIPLERHLAVLWCPEYNGGEPQTFFIEYQQEADEMWRRSGPIIDNMQVRMSNLLYNMTPNTRYCVRLLSRNKIGESKRTAVTCVMTLANQSSVKTSLSFQGIVIVVLFVIITVLGAMIGLYVRYLKQKIKRRMITPTNVPTTEASNDESAHYTEITGDDYRRIILQENDSLTISTVNIIGVENPDTIPQFSEHSSASSDNMDNNTNTSENYDDGMVTPTNVPIPEASSDESAFYTEINGDDYRRTSLQENNNPISSTVNIIGVENTDTAPQSSGHSSASSENYIDTPENYDDGYEKPYTTLVVQNHADNQHVYLTTNKLGIYENSTPFEKVACGRSFELRNNDTPTVETNPHVYENNDQENTNLSYIDNDFDKNDNDFHRSHIDQRKNEAEYINLMLK